MRGVFGVEAKADAVYEQIFAIKSELGNFLFACIELANYALCHLSIVIFSIASGFALQKEAVNQFNQLENENIAYTQFHEMPLKAHFTSQIVINFIWILIILIACIARKTAKKSSPELIKQWNTLEIWLKDHRDWRQFLTIFS